MRSYMSALVYNKEKDDWSNTKGLRLEKVLVPEIDESKEIEDAEKALVRVLYAGFCGSDKSIWFRKAWKDMIFRSLELEGKTTRIVGHEMVGEIVKIGSIAKKKYGLKEGDVVSTESHIICDSCLQCRIGQNYVCSKDQIIGISLDGCFAEYIKLPARVLWQTDINRIRAEIAALQEPFGNAVHCCMKRDLRGKSVAIFGCGTIGLFVILIARAFGASKIIGIEPLKFHQDLAFQLGIDHLIPLNPDKKGNQGWEANIEVVEQIKKLTDGQGVDVAMEMSGANSALNTAIKSTRRGGDVILFGISSANFTIQNYDRLIIDGISLYSVIGRQIFKTWYTTKSLLESTQNKIQEKIFQVILNGGKDTIIPIDEWVQDQFEKKITYYPKVLIKFI